MTAAAHEATVPLATLPRGRQRLAGLSPGQVVYGRAGRALRVVRIDEYVVTGSEATGPYAVLQACDDPAVRVIWPRHWYAAPGETGRLFA